MSFVTIQRFTTKALELVPDDECVDLACRLLSSPSWPDPHPNNELVQDLALEIHKCVDQWFKAKAMS